MSRTAPALALALACVSCTRATGIWIDRLEVDAFEGAEVVSMSEAQLEERLVAQLGAARFKLARGKPAPEGSKPWRVQLAAGLTEPDLDRQSSVVQVLLEFTHSGERDGFEVREHQLVQAPTANDVEALQLALKDALDLALGRAARESASLIALEGATVEVVEQRLAERDEATRRAAVRLLARARHRAALAPLLARLATDDADELRAVMGLLVELRAPEAVNPLVEATQRRGGSLEREVVFAVGAIGGADAEAYLDLVATGHDDPLLRASAEQALHELRSRRPAPDGGPR